jgi:hypothetical protein
MFIRYIKKMVPEIMISWKIEKKEAIKLAAERWNDMTQTQKKKYDEKLSAQGNGMVPKSEMDKMNN